MANLPYPRSDRSSAEYRASAAAAVATEEFTSAIDLRDYEGAYLWLLVSALAGATQARIRLFASDDGTTVPWSLTVGGVMADDSIVNGQFTGNRYSGLLTTATGVLGVGSVGPFRIPKVGGLVRVGITADAAMVYSVRAQRFN